MLTHVAVDAKGHKVIQTVIAHLAPLDLVVDLQVLQRPALLTTPFIPLQHRLHQLPANLFSQLDPFYFL
jgi:hypothetical protein